MLKQAVCSRCGAVNRVAAGKDPGMARCGRCSISLELTHPIEVDDVGLARHLEKTEGLVLIDVWAPWCGPCRAMAPNFSAAARVLAGQARLLTLNADQSSTARHLGVAGVPALLLFQNGRMIARKSGLMRADMLVHWVREHLAASAQSEPA